jgi:hypothetical protein
MTGAVLVDFLCFLWGCSAGAVDVAAGSALTIVATETVVGAGAGADGELIAACCFSSFFCCRRERPAGVPAADIATGTEGAF